MVEPIQPGRFVVFSNFEVDLHAGELRQAGKRLRLTGQPFQVLAVLLERAGDVVTRDELQKRLWPDTFVDVDHNLNTAINKIREALSDSADTPRFVETIPRRGYRFIGEIRTVPVAVAVASESRVSSSKWRKRIGALAAIGMAALALLTITRTRPRLSQPPRVLAYTQLTNDAGPKVILNFPWWIQLITNGPHIYFSHAASSLASHGFSEISSSGLAGTGTRSIETSIELPIPTGVSPDGSQLLATAGNSHWDRSLWLISLPSGSSRRLGALEGHDASWSPDGSTIVFAKDHELYRTDIDAKSIEKVASLPGGFATFIRWSPDGATLRFTVTDNFAATGSASLWQISRNGTDLHRLFPAWENSHMQECCGTWTANGKYFVFQATRDGVTGLWATSEGSPSLPKSVPTPVQLTSGPIRFTNPVPSQDGKRVFAIGEQLRGELTKFDLSSRTFVRYLSGISAEQLNFSKDGQWVTYVTYPESVLWRSRIDGSQRQQLTVPPLQVGAPHWSPTGEQIAFSGNMPGEKSYLYLIGAEGGNPVPITEGGGDPNWSPDGGSVMFFRVGEHGLDSTSTRILVVDLRTRQVSPLSASEGLYSSRWSPDGRYVAAITWDGRKLMLGDFRTPKWSELATGSIGWPNWSLDGKYVSYVDYGSVGPLVKRVRIEDRKIERVADLEQLRGLNAGRFWSYHGMAPDGSPLFLRNTGIQEIYALDVDLP